MQEVNLIICDQDYVRLMAMQPSPVLRAELERAIVVPLESMNNNVVRLGSLVTYRDHKTNSLREIKIVLPEDGDPAGGHISVLAPVGAALLGLSPGQEIEWDFPDGSRRSLTVISVVQCPGIDTTTQ